MELSAQLSPLDWGLLAVLALSVLVGLWRGLVFELMSLASWLVAWIASQVWGPLLAPWLAQHGPGPSTALLLGHALSFLATLLLCAVAARLAKLLVSATPLSVIDRALGAGFGLARGVLVLLVLAMLVSITPLAQWPQWQASRGAAWLGQTIDTLKPLWPLRPNA